MDGVWDSGKVEGVGGGKGVETGIGIKNKKRVFFIENKLINLKNKKA